MLVHQRVIKNWTQSADGQHFKWMQCTGKARRLVSVIGFETAGSTRSLNMGRHGQLTMSEGHPNSIGDSLYWMCTY